MSLYYVASRVFYLALCLTVATFLVRASQSGAATSWGDGLVTGLFVAGAIVSAIELWQHLRYSQK